MGKARSDKQQRKASKKEQRRLEKEREAELEVQREAMRRKRQIIVWAVPVVTIALALTAWFGFESRAVAGGSALGGAMIWLLVGLGYLGGEITPKDRTRAGSIDFGNRR